MHSFFHLIYFAHTFGYADRTYMRVFRYGKGRCAGQTDSIATKTAAVVRDTVSMVPGDVCLLVSCLTSQQQASVSQGRICSDSCTCCHTEMEVADQTFHFTQSQYTDTSPISPSADPITPGACRVATGVPILKSLV